MLATRSTICQSPRPPPMRHSHCSVSTVVARCGIVLAVFSLTLPQLCCCACGKVSSVFWSGSDGLVSRVERDRSSSQPEAGAPEHFSSSCLDRATTTATGHRSCNCARRSCRRISAPLPSQGPVEARRTRHVQSDTVRTHVICLGATSVVAQPDRREHLLRSGRVSSKMRCALHCRFLL